MKGEFKMKKQQIDLELARLLDEMRLYQVDSSQYQTRLNAYSALCEAKKKISIDPNTTLSVIGTMGEILTVLYFERSNIIISKAFGLIRRLR